MLVISYLICVFDIFVVPLAGWDLTEKPSIISSTNSQEASQTIWVNTQMFGLAGKCDSAVISAVVAQLRL